MSDSTDDRITDAAKRVVRIAMRESILRPPERGRLRRDLNAAVADLIDECRALAQSQPDGTPKAK